MLLEPECTEMSRAMVPQASPTVSTFRKLQPRNVCHNNIEFSFFNLRILNKDEPVLLQYNLISGVFALSLPIYNNTTWNRKRTNSRASITGQHSNMYGGLHTGA